MSDPRILEDTQRLFDEWAIRRCMELYCRGVDRRDFDLVRSSYHPDAHDDHGGYKGGVDGLIEWMKRRHETIEQSMHLIGNTIVEFTGQDAANVETYSVTYQRAKEGATEALRALGVEDNPRSAATEIRARYLDRFERRSGVWRIVCRLVVTESMVFENADDSRRLKKPFTLATRDQDDGLYRFFTPRVEG